MKTKRGQVALEFLTTYGWAIMVVMVMIGALAYFGVFNIKDQLPERCSFGTQLNCRDWIISTSNVTILISNNFEESIDISEFNATLSDGGCLCSASSLPVTIDSGGDAILAADSCSGCSLTEGSKIKFEASIVYRKSTGSFDHIQKGEIFATVLT
ncbi:hypothetical protein JW949_01175 [Candidatus Woesearchaeota archaeon]|nr:hypothetical protein [Candidatus Woesearchaeota archaeon]